MECHNSGNALLTEGANGSGSLGVVDRCFAFRFPGLVLSRAAGDGDQLPVSDSMCSYFGSEHEKVSTAALKGKGIVLKHPRSDLTIQVMRAMAYVPPGGPTYGYGQSHEAGSIDSYIWADFQKNGITPAPATTDWEFIRRVTLDLTGRIPTPTAVIELRQQRQPDQACRLYRNAAGLAAVGG